jgi:hypothetical protein
MESSISWPSIAASNGVQFDTAPSTFNKTINEGCADELSASDLIIDSPMSFPFFEIVFNLLPFNTLTSLDFLVALNDEWSTLWLTKLTSRTSNTPKNCSFKKDNVTFSNTNVVALSINSAIPINLMRTEDEKDPMVGAFVVEDSTGDLVVGAMVGCTLLICSLLIVTSCVNLFEGVDVSKVVIEDLVLGLCDGFDVVGFIDGDRVLGASLGLDVGDRLLGFNVVGLVLVGMGDGIVVGFALVGFCDDGLAVVGCVDGDIVGTLVVAIDELCVGIVGFIDGDKVLGASLGLDVSDRLLGFIVVGLVLVGMGDGIVVGFALVGFCDDGLAVVGCVDGDIVGTLVVAIDELCVVSLIVGETVEFSIFESEESK